MLAPPLPTKSPLRRHTIPLVPEAAGAAPELGSSSASGYAPLNRRHTDPLANMCFLNPIPPEFTPGKRLTTEALKPLNALGIDDDESASISLTRKPLRSSPLAGPALSSDGTFDDADSPTTTPTRTSFTPDLHSLSHLDPEGCRIEPLATPPSPSPSPSPSLPSFLAPPRASKGLFRPASLLQLAKRKSPPPALPLPPPPSNVSAPNKSSPSIVYTPPLSPPPLSPNHRVRPRSRGSFSASSSMTDLSASFPLPPPNFPRALTAPSTSRRSATRSSTLPLPSTAPAPYPDTITHRRTDSDQNWLTALPGDTPRFSRLGLAAPNVVLPLSARDSQRQFVRGAGGKRVSLAPLAAMPPRSRSFTHSRSNSISSEPPTPSAAAFIFSADNDVLLKTDAVTPPRSGSLICPNPQFVRGEGDKRVSLALLAAIPPRSRSLTHSRSHSVLSEPPTPSAAAFIFSADNDVLLKTDAVAPPRSSSLIRPISEYPASIPSLIRSRSHSLSSDGPPTPSAAAFIFNSDNVVLVKNDDEDQEDGPDLSLVSTHDFDVYASSESAHGNATYHKPPLAPARSAWSVSVGRQRHRRSYAKGTSFLSFGSGDSTSTSASFPMHDPAPSYSALRVNTETPTVRVHLTPYDEDDDATLGAYSPSLLSSPSILSQFDSASTASGKPAKAGGTVRRLLRSLSSIGRRGST